MPRRKDSEEVLKELSVRLHGRPVGLLSQDEAGRMRFAYQSGADQVLSLGLPLREEPYGEAACEAYFGGLLPEGEPARRAIGLKFGINPRNTFSLLKAIGYDCAGAVSLHEPEDPVREVEPVPLTAHVLTESELARHIRELPRKPLFIGVEGLRLSLAGAQDKAAVCLLNGQVALPTQGCPTTHILKPAIELIDGAVHNEAFCLLLAKALGFNVPAVEIRQAEGIPYLLVERYDRKLLPVGKLLRVHQEDFCQALGVVSALKYQREGGPGFRECFDLLRRTTRPALDRTQLAETMAFNFLMGNMDAHGKNFSLLHTTERHISMAPLYDVLCTRVYEGLTVRMAVRVGSEYELDKIYARHWKALCKDASFAYPALKKIFQRQMEALPQAAANIHERLQANGQDHAVIDQIIRFIDSQCERTAKRLDLS